jgi:predicted DCC family thiol-disulfide oxidoreductase YuxK
VSADAQPLDPAPNEPARPVVFFDGDCGLCERSVQFLLARDPDGALSFAPLQGAFARRLLPDAWRDVGPGGTVVLYEPDAGGRCTRRSEAILRALRYLPSPWGWLGALAAARPLLPLFDAAYRFVVRRRIRWFGYADRCRLPDPSLRSRFID